MNKRINKVLITGSTGFVGGNLAPYLEQSGFETIGVSRCPKGNDEISYSAIDSEIWNNSSAMIHLAGKVHDLKGVSNEKEYFEVNTELTKKLFNQFLKSDCEVFIYMSSVKAVADVVETILTEEVTPKPLTAYGKSKLAAEVYMQSQEIPRSKHVYILRPCMIYGHGNKGNLNLLYQFVNKGLPYPLGAFKNKRSLLSVENLCFVIEKLLKKQPESGIYNVADDQAIATTELIQIIAKSLQKKPRILNVSPKIINIVAKAGSICKLPFNKIILQKLTENYIVSNVKIKRNLGITRLFSTGAGLEKTLKSFYKE